MHANLPMFKFPGTQSTNLMVTKQETHSYKTEALKTLDFSEHQLSR